jgi:hypothetical protein
VTKFVNGLKREIQRAIKMHKPKTVDAALALAETREKMLEEMKQYPYSHTSRDRRSHFSHIGYPRKGLLPTPRAETGKSGDAKRTKSPWDDKVQALEHREKRVVSVSSVVLNFSQDISVLQMFLYTWWKSYWTFSTFPRPAVTLMIQPQAVVMITDAHFPLCFGGYNV